jgi:putative ribosome biogenesis GTPase RsgA
MKVLCKRTYFYSDLNSTNVPIFEKDKYYDCLDKSESFCEIKTENGNIIFNKKNFEKYFIMIDEIRDTKINEILNR